MYFLPFISYLSHAFYPIRGWLYEIRFWELLRYLPTYCLFFLFLSTEYGKSMTILKNSQSSTYDMPPITNGVGSLPRQLKLGSSAAESTAIGLLDYPATTASPRRLAQSETQRPVSGTEAGNTYNQPYSPIPTMFGPLSPSFPNGRLFQSPKFNYL